MSTWARRVIPLRALAFCTCLLAVSQVASADPAAPTAEGGAQDLRPSPSLPSQPASATSDAPPPAGGAEAGPAQAPSAARPDSVRDEDPRSLEQWKPELDQYGSWVDDQRYGRIWVPDRAVVGEGFSPYVTSGHWVLDTESNWVWVSDFPFGGIVFHYGRWVWTDYGWSWVPGFQYSPAWVVWRVPTGPYAYLGWAPAPPLYGWWGGAAFWFGYPPPYYWVFCPSMYAFSAYPYRYVVTNPTYVRTLGNYTRNYVAASPRSVGPPLSAARVPTSAVPARVQAAKATGATLPLQRATTGTAAPAPARATSLTRSAAPTATAPQAGGRALPPRVASPSVVYAPGVTSPRSGGFDRASPRPYSSTPQAGTRTLAPGRVYTPPSYGTPSRPYSAPAPRVYAPRTYGAPSYSAPAARGYSRPYSAPSYSAPRMYSPPSRVYSPPAPVYSAPRGSPSPSFGGGSRTYGGGARRR